MDKRVIGGAGVNIPSRFKIESQELPISKAKIYLEKATNESNSAILNDLRAIVRNQVDILKRENAVDAMTQQQASVLLKLTQTYKLMNDETKSEQKNYDFTQMSEEELKKLAGPAIE